MSSPITPAGGNWQTEVNRLRTAGYSLPHSNVQARLEAKRVAESVSRGSLTDVANRKMAADMNRRRLTAARGATASLRTASDLQLALPKARQPLSSFLDKGIPLNTQDDKDRSELVRLSRAYYATHDLVPLLIDVYSRFPVTGLEFRAKDTLIERFYSSMFLDELNYEEFLPEQLLREYYVAGEVTALAHFNESLGIWSSEEILNPDMVAVSKSLFVEQERVQLLVKDLVETLRSGPAGHLDSDERPSERLERNFEYAQLAKHYPEIIHAAARDDGLDISDALVSRIVNRASPWDQRGTPFLMRSMRTLMQEESLHAAVDAICDRLYAPMILATMGVENMGGDEPWIPSQAELDDLRDDMQNAFAADFKLLVHNFGVKIESVFGRETVPRFDQDYDRIDAKLMQAWGIGQALIMGGTGAGGTYASSAINREVCEQLMKGVQKKVIRHMRKRMEIIAEAQEHYDYDLKGGLRVPLYREIVEEDPETGEQRIVRVPKLLLPEIEFSTLNLRDETQERAFVAQLKTMGVPVSDKSLALNINVDAEQELEREALETKRKGMAKARVFKEMQDECDREDLPYPPELVAHLQSTLTLREMIAQTKLMESQAAMASPEMQAQMALSQAGMGLPADQGAEMPGMGTGIGMPIEQGIPQSTPPTASGPAGVPMIDPTETAAAMPEPARNRTRPPESDEMRANSPRAASATQRWAARVHGEPVPNRFEEGPSSYGQARYATEDRVKAAIQRREMAARHSTVPLVSQLVDDPDFYQLCHATGDEAAIRADWPEIRAGGAPESARLLRDLLSQYEEITGMTPIFD